MTKIEAHLLSLAGEYRVCSELCKRGVLATLTCGSHKRTDLYVLDDRRHRFVKIEVKSSQQGRFSTRITQTSLAGDMPDFWVLYLLQANPDGTFTERFFVLTHQELRDAQAARNVTPTSPSSGDDHVTVAEVEQHEDQWGKIIDQLRNGEATGGPFTPRDKAHVDWSLVDAIHDRLTASGRTFSDSADLLREDRDR